MTAWFPLTSTVQVLLYTMSATTEIPLVSRPASGDFSSHLCPLPALAVQVQMGPGGGGKHEHGEFPNVSLHHLNFKVWNRSPGGCGLQFTSFLVDGSPGALLSAGPLEKGQEPPGTPSGDRNVSNPNHDGKQKEGKKNKQTKKNLIFFFSPESRRKSSKDKAGFSWNICAIWLPLILCSQLREDTFLK